MEKVVILARVSTDRQEYQRQVNELTDYCNRAGWNVEDTFCNKVSGAKTIEERQEIQDLIAYVKDHKISRVVCLEISRLGRNTLEALQTSEDTNIKDKVNYGLNLVENLDRYFSNASAETKIRLLGSIFNEDIQFDGENYRTSNFNSMLGFIYQNSSELQGKTEADSPVFSGKSAWVAPRGIEPRFKV